jgi:hypothetical protein
LQAFLVFFLLVVVGWLLGFAVGWRGVCRLAVAVFESRRVPVLSMLRFSVAIFFYSPLILSTENQHVNGLIFR